MEFSRCARRAPLQYEKPAGACRQAKPGLSKLNSERSCVEVDVDLGEPASRTTCNRTAGHRTGQAPPEYKCSGIPRKEVIQPQLPLRLPCYDFTPIINPTFDGCLLAVSSPASGIADFRGVTGGVYKPRVRIHRGVADPRLLATPPS